MAGLRQHGSCRRAYMDVFKASWVFNDLLSPRIKMLSRYARETIFYSERWMRDLLLPGNLKQAKHDQAIDGKACCKSPTIPVR